MKQVFTNHNHPKSKEEKWYHDFDIIEHDDVKILNRTNGGEWTEEFKGKEAARIIDYGDDLTIIFDQKRKIKLDYSQAEELFILLSQCEFSGIEIKESKTTMKWPLSQ